MEHSESLKELATALSAAQGEIENAHKNATNPHFGKTYADLAEVLNTARPVLSKHGLAVVQLPGWEDGRVTVETMLTHKSGEWVRGLAQSPVPRLDPQGVGAACTYLRRYSLAAVVGIAQEDDDAEGAVGRESEGPAVAQARSQAPAAPPRNGPSDVPACEKCKGAMWDNRNDKRSPNYPDFKCKDKGCGHAVWIDSKKGKKRQPATVPETSYEDFQADFPEEEDDLPF